MHTDPTDILGGLIDSALRAPGAAASSRLDDGRELVAEVNGRLVFLHIDGEEVTTSAALAAIEGDEE
ncbi:MAG: hypothetical protein ACOC9T_03355 [Myxococcota bacterium]